MKRFVVRMFSAWLGAGGVGALGENKGVLFMYLVQTEQMCVKVSEVVDALDHSGLSGRGAN